MNFYTPENIAQRIVADSMADPMKAWALECIARGGQYDIGRDIYRFADGSAVAFTPSCLPVEYIGA